MQSYVQIYESMPSIESQTDMLTLLRITVMLERTPCERPRALWTFVDVYVEWIVVLLPASQLLLAHEADDIVWIVRAGTEVEACVGERVRVGCKAVWMGPP